MELPRNCRLVRTKPQRLSPTWAKVSREEYDDGEGICSIMFGSSYSDDDLWLVLEYPEGVEATDVVHLMQSLGGLWDVVLGPCPQVLLIKDKPYHLPFERLCVDGAAPQVRTRMDADLPEYQRRLYDLMILGYWSMLGPERMANMRLEGMEQAEKKDDECVLWGSWSNFVDPDQELC